MKPLKITDYPVKMKNNIYLFQYTILTSFWTTGSMRGFLRRRKLMLMRKATKRKIKVKYKQLNLIL